MPPRLFMEKQMRDLPQQMAMQQLQGSSDCAPITRDELVEMFGGDMPIEAVNLLRNTPGCMTIGEVRVELRKMAMQQLQGSGAGQVKEVVVTIIAQGDNENTPEEAVHHGLEYARRAGFIEAWNDDDAARIEALEAALREIKELANSDAGISPREAFDIAEAALAPEQDK